MCVDLQELRGSALQLLGTGLAASPRVSGARPENWPAIKIALEGLGLPADAVTACKIWLLQVMSASPMLMWLFHSICRLESPHIAPMSPLSSAGLEELPWVSYAHSMVLGHVALPSTEPSQCIA
jgi:hypothetical protein